MSTHVQVPLTHSHTGTLEYFVCYFSNFENNFGIKSKFTKYLKESCYLASHQHFSFKCFFRNCICKFKMFKIIRAVLAALFVNGLTHSCSQSPPGIVGFSF